MCCVLGRTGGVALVATLIVAAMLWWHNRVVPEYYSPAPWWLQSELRQLPSAFGPGSRPVVLLTGMAGFIGYHTAVQLHAEGTAVIGIDNFNHYYDPALKAARAAHLRKAAATGGAYLRLFQADACDGEMLKLLLREGRVTHVIHLAAQAGVRYSLKKPLAYVEANVRCFVTLLEAVKDVNKSIPITYASSSSVYGLNTEVPFSEKHRIDRQASLYGATKQSNERIAHVYHHLHGLKLTGLRFFTVYGPLGRPDMAYFSFTQDILSGRAITEFRNPDGTELMRDFTYVSDIVAGIVAASRLAAPLEVFNLGNRKPEPVSRLITLLEAGLGRKANVRQAPISAGDVPMTYADVTHAATLLGYQPQVRAGGGGGGLQDGGGVGIQAAGAGIVREKVGGRARRRCVEGVGRGFKPQVRASGVGCSAGWDGEWPI
eukprot:scaffold12578_cov128-Isochrysis_galbana.AAC.6